MKHFSILIFIYLFSIGLSAQSIPDREFSWSNITTVSSGNENSEVFAKVELDPSITQYNQSQFKALIQNSIDEMQLSIKTTG